jgi:hypothetical protein
MADPPFAVDATATGLVAAAGNPNDPDFSVGSRRSGAIGDLPSSHCVEAEGFDAPQLALLSKANL